MNSKNIDFGSNDPFEADLKSYLDGELPLLRRFQVRRHLSHCSQCQKELKIMQTISQELEKEEETAPLGADLRAKILGNAPVETTEITVRKSRYRAPLEYVFALVPICLVVFVMLSMMGKRVQNSFNAAANAITTGEDFDKRPSAWTGLSPMAAAPGAASAESAFNAPKLGMSRRETDSLTNAMTAGNANATVQSGSSSFSGAGNSAYFTARSVHKEGSLTVAVDNAEAKGGAVENMVKSAGGFVASNALSTGSNGQKAATLDVRVPVEKFEAIVQKIGALGTVRAKSINGEDITARVVATNAQRETLQEELSMAQARLRQKENKARKGDAAALVPLRYDVRQLRMQASQARAQLEMLRKFAALSTLYVTLQDKPKAVAPASFSGTLGQTSREAWSSFVSTARLPIQLLIWMIAYSPFWIPAFIVWKKYGRKFLTD